MINTVFLIVIIILDCVIIFFMWVFSKWLQDLAKWLEKIQNELMFMKSGKEE